jgi:hypothetical protein
VTAVLSVLSLHRFGQSVLVCVVFVTYTVVSAN